MIPHVLHIVLLVKRCVLYLSGYEKHDKRML